VDITMTFPPPGLSCLIASNAALPPPSLSDVGPLLIYVLGE
jgi:hypothetical protein